MEPTDETRLIQRICQGDTRALGELYDRYGGLLFSVAIHILSDPEASKDLVHDVFLEAWRSATEFDPERGNVRAWLLVRLRSRALDRRRCGYATRVTVVEDLERLEKPSEVEEDPQLGPDREAIRRAMGLLSFEQRVVIELAYFEGLSSSEIALRTEVPLGTVKSRVAAALARLRVAMRGAA